MAEKHVQCLAISSTSVGLSSGGEGSHCPGKYWKEIAVMEKPWKLTKNEIVMGIGKKMEFEFDIFEEIIFALHIVIHNKCEAKYGIKSHF